MIESIWHRPTLRSESRSNQGGGREWQVDVCYDEYIYELGWNGGPAPEPWAGAINPDAIRSWTDFGCKGADQSTRDGDAAELAANHCNRPGLSADYTQGSADNGGGWMPLPDDDSALGSVASGTQVSNMLGETSHRALSQGHALKRCENCCA